MNRAPLIALLCAAPFACTPSASDRGAAPEAPASTPASTPAEAAPLTVAATFYPTAWMAQRLTEGLPGITARDLCPPDQDPAFWRPDPEALAALQSADLILLNGAGYERWLSTASLPLGKQVDTTRAFRDELITYDQTITHSHGPGGAHTHKGVDGHTWLDPLTALLQARAVHQALVQRRPDLKAQLDANLLRLGDDLRSLDAALRIEPAPRLIAAHPAYRYLARRYGWALAHVDLAPDAPPTAAQRAALKAAAAQGQRIVLWPEAPAASVAAALRQEGLTSVTYATGATAPAQGDLLSLQRANVAALKAALQATLSDPSPAPPPAAP